jgi:hypothetical protein
VKCPKCGYERGLTDEAPVWRCPACKIAYVKAASAAVSSQAEPPLKRITSAAEQIPDSEAGSRRERTLQKKAEVEVRVREWSAARGQRTLIYCTLLNFLLGAVERAHAVPDLLMVGLYILTAAWSLLGVVRICSGLQRSQGQKILFMVLMFFPLISLLVLVYLSVKATRLLREAGWSVGLLGARQ